MAVKENRAFSEMLAVAQNRLAGRSPLEIAEKAHVTFVQEQQVFLFSSLGENIIVHYPSYTIEPQLEEWRHLVILHYLEMADGTPLNQRFITFGELRDGLVRGSGFDRTCEQAMALYFGKSRWKTCKRSVPRWVRSWKIPTPIFARSFRFSRSTR